MVVDDLSLSEHLEKLVGPTSSMLPQQNTRRLSDSSIQSTLDFVVVKEDDQQEVHSKGEICELKDVFACEPHGKEHTSRPKKVREWREEQPTDIDIDGQKSGDTKLTSFAILRRRRTAPGNTKQLITETLEINSPRLLSVLAKVFKTDVSYDVDQTLVFRPRFLPFIHHWEALLTAAALATDKTTKSHLDLLCSTVYSEIKDDLERLRKIKETGDVTFADIELVFVPGEIVFERTDRPETSWAGTLRSITLTRSQLSLCYKLIVEAIEWDGINYGIVELTWQLFQFNGSKPLSDVSVTLLSSLPDERAVRERLAARGRRVRSLSGVHVKEYNGLALFKDRDFATVLSERVVIDTIGYYELENMVAPVLRGLDDKAPVELTNPLDFHVMLDTLMSTKIGQPPTHMLRDDQYMLMNPWIRGFALDRKQWGKGEGLVMLFCGPPGAGKTLAAELLADELRRPLYRLNMLDIDLSLSGVERGLEKALLRCARWNAILLIDDADVFLEARSFDAHCRNEVVSVFLRQLEYYKGTVIMTSNRIRDIDPAFNSRIDVTVPFERPGGEARLQIWKNNIEALDAVVEISADELQILADEPLDGRQIRSTLKTAMFAFGAEESPLNFRHVQTIIKNRRKTAELLSGR